MPPQESVDKTKPNHANTIPSTQHVFGKAALSGAHRSPKAVVDGLARTDSDLVIRAAWWICISKRILNFFIHDERVSPGQRNSQGLANGQAYVSIKNSLTLNADIKDLMEKVVQQRRCQAVHGTTLRTQGVESLVLESLL